jgi:hypothetical protein
MWNRLIKPGKSIASLLLLTLILPHSGISVAQSIELDKKLGAENAKIVEAQMGLVPITVVLSLAVALILFNLTGYFVEDFIRQFII